MLLKNKNGVCTREREADRRLNRADLHVKISPCYTSTFAAVDSKVKANDKHKLQHNAVNNFIIYDMTFYPVRSASLSWRALFSMWKLLCNVRL